MTFQFFIEPSATFQALKAAGSSPVQMQSAQMLANMARTADSALGLGGALIAWMATHQVQFVEVSEMSDAEWSTFLDQRARGRAWNRWYGRNSGHRYNVVVFS